MVLCDQRGSEQAPGFMEHLPCKSSWGPVAKKDYSEVRQTWVCISDPRSCVILGKLLNLS